MIKNIDTTNNTLLAIDLPSYAEGNITQDASENDFSSVKNLTSSWLLSNTLSTSSADNVITNTLIEPDSIIIISYNSNYQKLDFSNVTYIEEPIFQPMTSNTAPEGTAISSQNGTAEYKAFDNDTSTYFEISDASNTGYIGYKFKNNESYKIYQYYLKTGDNSGTDYSLSSGWTVEGSVDGTNWATIGDYQGVDNINRAIGGGIFSIQSPGSFEAYRLVVAASNSPRIYNFNLLDSSKICSLDTSSITAGGTADGCFISNDKIFFNDYESTKIDIDWNNITINGSKIEVHISHADNDLGNINTNIITNRIEIHTIGNEFLGLDSDLFKNTNKPS